MRKKNILLVIRRGQPELEWITPILYKLSKNNNIYIFFLSQKAFNNLSKNNPIFLILKKICKKIFIQNYKSNFFWRLLKKVLAKNNSFIDSKIHDPNYLISKLSIKNKIDIIFTEYGNTSQWIRSFIKLKEKPLIINYPSSPLSFGKGFDSSKSKYYKKKLICDYVFLILKKDFYYWSKSIDKEKMLFCGNPSYDEWWIKKVSKHNGRVQSNKKSILYAYNSDFGLVPKEQEKIFEQDLYFFMKTFIDMKNMKNVSIIFKIHPLRNNPYYLNILNMFPKNRWSISELPLSLLSKKTRITICTHGSAAILNGLYAKKPSLEFCRSYFKNSVFPKRSITEIAGISLLLKKNNLKKILTKAIYFPNDNIWIKQKNKFASVYNPDLNASKKICKTIFDKLVNES